MPPMALTLSEQSDPLDLLGARGLLPTALLVIASTALALALVAPHWDPRTEAWGSDVSNDGC